MSAFIMGAMAEESRLRGTTGTGTDPGHDGGDLLPLQSSTSRAVLGEAVDVGYDGFMLILVNE